MSRIRIAVALGAAVLVAAVGTGSALAAGTLKGADGPGFTITLSAKTVKAGTYKIVISDKSNIHNFHLTGRSDEQRHPDGHRRPRLHDLAEREDGQSREVQDRGLGQGLDSQLPPDGSRREQDHEHLRHRHVDVERDAEEGDLQVPVRRARIEHARDPESHLSHKFGTVPGAFRRRRGGTLGSVPRPKTRPSARSANVPQDMNAQALDEKHYGQIDVVLLTIEDARRRAERAAAELRDSGGETFLVEALEKAQEELALTAKK